MSYMQSGYNNMDSGAGFYQQDTTAGTKVSPKKFTKSAASESRIAPVTCRQIIAATVREGDDNISIDGKEVMNVTVVGAATKVDVTTTMCTFELEDGTGVLKVRMFIMDSNGNNNNGGGGGGAQSSGRQIPDGFAEGRYCRVFARVSNFSSMRGLTAHRILMVTDFNEITYHAMEAKFVQLSNKLLASGVPFGAAAGAGGIAVKTQGYGYNAGYNSNGGGGAANGAGGAANGAGGAGGNNFAFVSGSHDARTKALQNQVLDIIRQNAVRGQETSKASIKAAIPGARPQDVDRAVEFLFQEAFIYNASDEHNFLPTDASPN